jgi:DNA-binding NtrC family response regulator
VSSIESHDSNNDLNQAGGTDVGFNRGEALAVAARLSGAIPTGVLSGGFDPSMSYGKTRAAFEADFEQRYVSWLLTRHSGNISAAAREARMDRKHLHDLAKKHGLRGRGSAPRRQPA